MNKKYLFFVWITALFGVILIIGCTQKTIEEPKSQERILSCHEDKTNPDCFCNDDEVRMHTFPASTKISEYICKFSDCKEDSYCEEKFGDHYICFKTDNRTPDKGFCEFGLTTN